MFKTPLIFIFTVFLVNSYSSGTYASDHWFEKLKTNSTDQQLYGFLLQMPKGGDIHHHITGSNFSEWWWELAIDENRNGGYRYYTKTQLLLCSGMATDEFGVNKNLLLFKTIQESTFNQLSDCEKQEFQRMSSLDSTVQEKWMNSIRLDLAHEGRNEFFETHWARLNDLLRNPDLMGEMLVKNMQAYALEGVRYLETQISMANKLKPDGTRYTPEQALHIITQRIQQPDALATHVVVRFQYMLLRFTDDAEQQLEWIYKFVSQHRDWYVGINMAGREDNDKGHPGRFLPVLRKLRQRYPRIPMSLHAGEVDEPNFHVRDTLLLGADRIGHGLNLITDPQTMLLMRHNRYLVEINLISNLLLEYVDEYGQHPFPEYLRTGIPVALSTDDRGMWDSTLTDEFFVAVKEFNLSWNEIKQLSLNSLTYSFVEQKVKDQLIQDFEEKIQAFEQGYQNEADPSAITIDVKPRHFICRHYKICSQVTD